LQNSKLDQDQKEIANQRELLQNDRNALAGYVRDLPIRPFAFGQ
jgi:hypothetical protein